MAKDKKGKLIDVGDRVTLEGIVERVSDDENFATLAIMPVLPYKPVDKITVKVEKLKIIEKFDTSD